MIYLSVYTDRSCSSSPSVVRGCTKYRICIYSTDPTQETCCYAVDHEGYTAPTRQHELNHTDHTRSGIDDLSALKDLDHDLSVDYLSDVCMVARTHARLLMFVSCCTIRVRRVVFCPAFVFTCSSNTFCFLLRLTGCGIIVESLHPSILLLCSAPQRYIVRFYFEPSYKELFGSIFNTNGIYNLGQGGKESVVSINSKGLPQAYRSHYGDACHTIDIQHTRFVTLG